MYSSLSSRTRCFQSRVIVTLDGSFFHRHVFFVQEAIGRPELRRPNVLFPLVLGLAHHVAPHFFFQYVERQGRLLVEVGDECPEQLADGAVAVEVDPFALEGSFFVGFVVVVVVVVMHPVSVSFEHVNSYPEA
mmetsp:Transcript_28113/g.51893  ORF Transcript_28113/g.51893 Transcript_28113/m.51893 type:complete len:133 (-) Transcript_28113:175-573(-)